jgi:hypothetical protein
MNLEPVIKEVRNKSPREQHGFWPQEIWSQGIYGTGIDCERVEGRRVIVECPLLMIHHA